MKNRGFIGTIVLLIIAFVLLKVWFDIDVFKWLNSPKVKEFFTELWDVIVYVWTKFLKEPVQVVFRFIHDTITKFRS